MTPKYTCYGLLGLAVILVTGSGCNDELKAREAQIALIEDNNRRLTDQLSGVKGENENLLMERNRLNQRLAALQSENNQLRDDLAHKPEPAVPEGWQAVPGGAMIAISDSILFASGKAVLRDSGKQSLDAVISTINSEYPEKDVFVVGHTDDSRRGRTFEFPVADCKGFATVGEYDDGQPGEIFLTVSKQGSTLSGIMDAFAKSISYGLQYGVPLRAYVEAFVNMKFEPAGMTDDPDVRFAGSIMDYLFRRLALEYMTYDERAELGIFTIEERTQPTLPGVEEAVIMTSMGSEMASDPKSVPSADELAAGLQSGALAPTVEDNTPARGVLRPIDSPMCMQCGVHMVRAGSCHACPSCGNTSGCS